MPAQQPAMAASGLRAAPAPLVLPLPRTSVVSGAAGSAGICIRRAFCRRCYIYVCIHTRTHTHTHVCVNIYTWHLHPARLLPQVPLALVALVALFLNKEQKEEKKALVAFEEFFFEEKAAVVAFCAFFSPHVCASPIVYGNMYAHSFDNVETYTYTCTCVSTNDGWTN